MISSSHKKENQENQSDDDKIVHEDFIDDELSDLNKKYFKMNKCLHTSLKEEQLLENRNKILNMRKENYLKRLELFSADEDRIKSIRVNKNKSKKMMEIRNEKEIINLKMKKSHNLSVKMKRDNTLKNWKINLTKKNQKEGDKARKERINRETLQHKSKENNLKLNKDKLNNLRILNNISTKKKNDEEFHKKLKLKANIEEKNKKKLLEINELEAKIENQKKENQKLMNILNSFRNKNNKKFQKNIIKRNIKTVKSVKTFNVKNQKIPLEKKDSNISKGKKKNKKLISKNDVLLKNLLERQKKERENLLDGNIGKEDEKYSESNLKDEKKVKIYEKEKEKKINLKINQTLEDMCVFGNIVKAQIKEEKEKNPEKYIETEKALKLKDEDEGLFTLGLLSKNLESLGMQTLIGKDEVKYNDKGFYATSLQFLCNGYINKKKYKLHFDFGKERNEEILNNNLIYEEFKEKLKLKISKDYNISNDKIIVTFLQRGSVDVQVIFQSDEFNNLNTTEFLNKFKNDENKEFSELKNLKEIHSDVLMEGCSLGKDMLDPRGNRKEGWGQGEQRGKKPYNPPIGWIGIGLKAMDIYENNTWIGMDNIDGEWCVAYHGVGNEQESDKVKEIACKIIKEEKKFKIGPNQVHKDCKDKFHEGKTVGDGAYCTPNIQTAEEYAGISEINGIKYKTVIMVRVKPEAIRCCGDCYFAEDYWVVNGTSDEIRPYRILYKKVEN